MGLFAPRSPNEFNTKLSCLASVWECEKNKDNDHNISSLSRRLRTVFLFSVKFLDSFCFLFVLIGALGQRTKQQNKEADLARRWVGRNLS